MGVAKVSLFEWSQPGLQVGVSIRLEVAIMGVTIRLGVVIIQRIV